MSQPSEPNDRTVAAGGPDFDASGLSGHAEPDSSEATIWPPNWSVGPYRPLECIGSGGMGEVWLAEQIRPVRRRVALKLIRAGMDTVEVVARFQAERQALALMDHPSIAKVFDAGSTPQGRPYFAMEYIAGTPITQYCDEHRMPLPQRLELFIQVCEGVQHAHQKAIIHRDLKPSNILISEVDGKPVPRIIDFGVARATLRGLIAETQLTQTGGVLGTPAYMSPEQAWSGGADVDTRSDVYSLGVVMYELLVGVRPLDFRELPLPEVLRRLREEEAPLPSTKLRTLGEGSAATAQCRGTDPPALVQQLRGDLDAIVQRTLEKDRSRRYGSPAELAEDIRRYLNHEAVLAIPASAVYRARKFARRYRRPLATAFAFALVLVMATAVSIRQSIVATGERDRANMETATAQAVSEFLQNDLLSQSAFEFQWTSSGKIDPDLKVRTALDRAAARIAGKFDRQPEVEAAIRDTIGWAFLRLTLPGQAEKHFKRSLELHARDLGPEHPKTLKTRGGLASAIGSQGRYEEAVAMLRQLVTIERSVLGPAHLDTLDHMSALANYLREQGKYNEAERIYHEIVQAGARVLGPQHVFTLYCMSALAKVYYREGKYSEAEVLGQQALDSQRRVLGPDHPDTTISLSDLGNVYAAQGRFSLAESAYTEAFQVRRRVLGASHPITLAAGNNLAVLYSDQGKYAQAEALDIETLDSRKHALGPENPETLMSMGNLAVDYSLRGKYTLAETLFAQTLAIERRVMGIESRFTIGTLSDRASMYQREGKYALAAADAAQALAAWRHSLGADSPVTMQAAADLALAYLSQGKFIESGALAREAFEFDQKKQPDDWQRFRAESLLGASLAGQREYKDAEPLLLEGYQGMLTRKERIAIPDRYHLDRSHEWLMQLYRAWGRPDKAAEWKDK